MPWDKIWESAQKAVAKEYIRWSSNLLLLYVVLLWKLDTVRFFIFALKVKPFWLQGKLNLPKKLRWDFKVVE